MLDQALFPQKISTKISCVSNNILCSSSRNQGGNLVWKLRLVPTVNEFFIFFDLICQDIEKSRHWWVPGLYSLALSVLRFSCLLNHNLLAVDDVEAWGGWHVVETTAIEGEVRVRKVRGVRKVRNLLDAGGLGIVVEVEDEGLGFCL